MILWGSISLAQDLMQADLIDGFQLHICPISVGGGRLLFAASQYKNFDLIDVKRYDTGVVCLVYIPKSRQ